MPRPTLMTTSNVRIRRCSPIPSPAEERCRRPIAAAAARTVETTRSAISDILIDQDDRLMVIIGPCSIHDPQAALAYAEALLPLTHRYGDDLLLIMRTYFEKPRTTVGWKGLINDPHLDGSSDLATGLRRARDLVADLTDMGLPCATEFLDPVTPQYIADHICWAAIGARTTESQNHREMAAGLSMPVGFKNGTAGQLDIALNALSSAAHPHVFRGIDDQGRVCQVEATGNPDAHLVLRGSTQHGPNYDQQAITAAAALCAAAGRCERVVVDASHDNTREQAGSAKDYRRQEAVCSDLADSIAAGAPVAGVMIESHLVAGNQPLATPAERTWGQSITDGCIDLAASSRCLDALSHAVRQRRASLKGSASPRLAS